MSILNVGAVFFLKDVFLHLYSKLSFSLIFINFILLDVLKKEHILNHRLRVFFTGIIKKPKSKILSGYSIPESSIENLLPFSLYFSRNMQFESKAKCVFLYS